MYPSALYHNDAEKPGDASPFFSAIPRAVWDLCQSKALKGRDVQVLGILLDHKNRRTTQVDPKQETIALRLGCSLPTVERSIARLVKVGLITKTRLRNALGRLGRCSYDLANTLSLMPRQASNLMPRQASKMRGGDFGASSSAQSPVTDGEAKAKHPPTSHQKCRVSEADSSDVAKADNNTPAPPKPPPPPVAVALMKQGVSPHIATRLVEQRGEERCQQVLSALSQRRKVRNRAAWLVGCLLQGWIVEAPATARPRSHHPYTPPSAPHSPPTDILDALPSDAYATLEDRARALLWDETMPAWRDRLLSDLNKPPVRARIRTRMRDLLDAQTP